MWGGNQQQFSVLIQCRLSDLSYDVLHNNVCTYQEPPWLFFDLILTGLDSKSSPSTSVAELKPSKPVARPAAPSVPSTLNRLKSRQYEEEQDPTCAAATLRVLKEKVAMATSTR